MTRNPIAEREFRADDPYDNRVIGGRRGKDGRRAVGYEGGAQSPAAWHADDTRDPARNAKETPGTRVRQGVTTPRLVKKSANRPPDTSLRPATSWSNRLRKMVRRHLAEAVESRSQLPRTVRVGGRVAGPPRLVLASPVPMVQE